MNGGGLVTAARSRSMTVGVLAATTVLVVVLAVTATGYPVNHVSANDGGVWLVDDSAGTGFAEMNVPIQQLGAHFGAPGSTTTNSLDVLQDGTSIFAIDQHKDFVYPVDEAAGTIDAKSGVTYRVAVTGQEQVGGGGVALGGGTVALLDPGSGAKASRLWAGPVGSGSEPSLEAVQRSARPLATLDGGAAVSVDDFGDVFFASTSELLEFRLSSGGFESAVKIVFPKAFSSVELTTVGTDPVVFDPGKGTLFFPSSGATSQLEVNGPVALQQSGPESPSVLIATSESLLSVPLAGGTPTTVATVPARGGRPAQPVALDGCDYGAWAGSPGYDVEACPATANAAKAAAALQYQNQSDGNLTDPVLRVNNNFVVLNDSYDGGAWLVAGTPAEVLDNDDWIKLYEGDKPSNSDNSQGQTTISEAEKPKLDNPTLYARAGQQSVLHVLDHDSDPNNSPLSITTLTPATGPGYALAISPDTQTVVLTLDSAFTGAVQFTYSVIDGKGQTVSGPVSVQVTTKESSPAPTGDQPQLHIVSGGSASFSVLSNWRDPESDPISLAQAQVNTGQISWTSDGMVTYTAPTSEGDVPVNVTYSITDGRSAPVQQTQSLVVVGSGDTTAYPATAEADVAQVVVGQSATISPLSNDRFGADPADPGAKLALGGQIGSVAGLDVTTNTVSGQITVDATQAGSYLLSYQDAFGSAPPSPPVSILIEAVPPPTSVPPPPVTTPVSVVVHGTNPTTVDVLASDFDPAGGLLTVTGLVSPVPQGIEAAVQQGQFLRIATTMPPASTSTPVTQVVSYQVTDGKQSATGQVDVTEEPLLASAPPVVPITYATVRAGNEIDVPVLAQASDPNGQSISLLDGASQGDTVELAKTTPSQVGYKSGLGQSSVSGAYLRYLAPPGTGLSAPETVTASFIVEAADGSRTTGQTIVTVLPDSTADTQPQPVEADARVAAGGTVAIPIVTTGVDPDGQDVTVTGITSTPGLGRVIAVQPTEILYQAYPVSSISGPFSGGTDTFSYQVTSPSGQGAQANVRVGVTPPVSVQPPVAIDHFATGAPGQSVVVNLLAGDVIAAGDHVKVEPLGETNHSVPNGARLVGHGQTLEVKAPTGAEPPLNLAYAISDGTGTPSVAHVVVRAQPRYSSSPVAADYFPRLPSRTAKTLTVNVLAKDSDPAGSQGDLKIVDPPVRHTVIKGPDLVLPVNTSPVAIPYTIESKATGQKSVGVVHVPGDGSGLELTSGTIHVPEGGSKTVNIASYISDPGHTVRITTTDEVKASPAFGLTEEVSGNATVKLTGGSGYQGPGSLVVQVTDTASLSTPGAHVQTFALPVIVGMPTAIVRCPQDAIDLVEGGQSIKSDVTSLCQVWTPDGKDPSTVTFTESWAHQAPDVSLATSESGRSVSLVASSSATPGASGQLTIGVPGGGAEASSTLNVAVVKAPPPTMNPVNIPGVETGHSVTIDMTQYVQSPLAQPRISVEKVSPPDQGHAQVTTKGSSVTITPLTGSHGTEIFTVSVSDQGPSRVATGTITVQVIDRPSAPTGLQGDPSNQQVALSWSPSQPNGAPVTDYKITLQGGGSRDTTGTTYTWNDLQNGQNYTFTVQALNQSGTSDPSAPGTFAPKSVPDAPQDVTATGGNQQTTISWAKPSDNGQPILGYSITVTPSSGGPSSRTVDPGQTSYTWPNLDNNTGPYSFTVTARNAVGVGPTSAPSRPVYAHATPATPAPPTAAASVSPDQTTTTITVTWPLETPCNDAQPCQSYIVSELKNGSVVSTLPTTGGCGGSSAQCSASFGPITNDGSAYNFELQSVNQEGDTSTHSVSSNLIHADGVPGQITDLTATAKNSSASVSFTLPPSHGASISAVKYEAVSSSQTVSGSWANPGQSGQAVTETIGGLSPVVSYSVTVAAANELGESGPNSNAVSVTPYGNPQPPALTATGNGNNITYTWGPGPSDGLNYTTISYCITGQGCSTSSGQGTTQQSYGYGCGATGTISATETDSAGQTSDPASRSATTAACPQPQVTVSWGVKTGSAHDSICGGDTSCTYLTISWANFNSGSHTVTPLFDNGSWGYASQTVSGSSGSFGNFYAAGYCNQSHTVTATVDGVGSSNSINTTSHGC